MPGSLGVNLQGTALDYYKTEESPYAFNWSINDSPSLRAGIDKLFDVKPAITGATAGRPAGTNLADVCNPDQEAKGCADPASYSPPNSDAGTASRATTDVLGRRYFLGLKARF